MLWAFMIAAAAGLLLGFRFRVPAVIASSAGIAAVAVPLGLQAGLSLVMVALTAGALLLMHQCSYLVGLLVRHVWSRRRP